ncbi:MAG: hypothetical protein HUJ91_06905, partial [Bacteroidales bacterium]|nr:hypothetical protein [Bacteroidales bacterium]
YAGSYIRKLFMTANGLPDISFAKREEREFLQQAVSRIRPAFYRKTLDALDTAIRSIDANVLAKLVFTDLCNRFYLNI